MKIEGITYHGDKKDDDGRWINEDGLKILEFPQENIKIGIIMDGATGLGRKYQLVSNKTAAEWYVKTIIDELEKIFINNPTSDLKQSLEKCVTLITSKINQFEIENNMKLKDYETPSSAIAIIRINNEETELFILGDISAIVGYTSKKVKKINNPNKNKIKAYDDSVIRKMIKIAKKEKVNVIDTINSPKIQKKLQINRSKKNKNYLGSYYVCGTNPKAVKKGIYCKFKNNTLEKIILATDGIDYCLLNDNEISFYQRLKSISLNQVINSICEKQIEDNSCNKYPRLKKEDDKTLLIVNFKSLI